MKLEIISALTKQELVIKVNKFLAENQNIEFVYTPIVSVDMLERPNGGWLCVIWFKDKEKVI
jgi:hypothetical protein